MDGKRRSHGATKRRRGRTLTAAGLPFRNAPAGNRSRRGFTLVEVMITVVIVALLAGLLIPRLTGMERRRFRLLVDQVGDLLTMYAQREQLEQRPVGVMFDQDRGWLMLVQLEPDTDGDVPSDWLIDPYVSPVNVPAHVFLDVAADGDPVDISEWPLATTPHEERPGITIRLQSDEHFATITLPAHAIIPQQSEINQPMRDGFQPVDLDSAGRSREDW